MTPDETGNAGFTADNCAAQKADIFNQIHPKCAPPRAVHAPQPTKKAGTIRARLCIFIYLSSVETRETHLRKYTLWNVSRGPRVNAYARLPPSNEAPAPGV